jgi:hypothetical protein
VIKFFFIAGSVGVIASFLLAPDSFDLHDIRAFQAVGCAAMFCTSVLLMAIAWLIKQNRSN